jgi:hypothetical protein
MMRTELLKELIFQHLYVGVSEAPQQVLMAIIDQEAMKVSSGWKEDLDKLAAKLTQPPSRHSAQYGRQFRR